MIKSSAKFCKSIVDKKFYESKEAIDHIGAADMDRKLNTPCNTQKNGKTKSNTDYSLQVHRMPVYS